MITDLSHKKIRFAIIASSILKEPFVCFYLLLPYFLLKDLQATALHTVIYTSTKPISSFFSFYFSELVSRQGMTLKYAMLWAGILARIAFIPALIFNDVNLYILGSTMYMIFTRAETPAWMEAIKINVHREKWEKTFSKGTIVGYSTGILITILCTSWIDDSLFVWKASFAISLVLGLIAVLIQALMIDNDHQVKTLSKGVKQTLSAPVKEGFSLLKQEPEFARFLWSFMIGGLGLMIIQPVIQIYFTDVLFISYSDLMISFCICKALGVVFTTPIWNTLMKNVSFNFFVFLVLGGFALFSFFLMFSQFSISFIYVAYLFSGISQAGSHLVWHLSGPIFSKEHSSTQFTAVNVLMVGIRGLVGPAMGWGLLYFIHPTYIFMISMLLCLSGNFFYVFRRTQSVESNS
ncbi:MAG: hypothetical protein S4CHLAM20_02360 [Chlamydiia bacterium]|nr:hypothetical protein [Chlamydiia bacterium]